MVCIQIDLSLLYTGSSNNNNTQHLKIVKMVNT